LKPSKKEFEILFEELFEMKKDDAVDILKLINKPFDYLFLDVYLQKFFLNLKDEIII
jgi:hypothetical protein